MFDVWFGGVEITTVVLIVSVLLLLPTQLLLCFKVRNLLIRLLPAIELAVSTFVFTVLYFISVGWDRIGYLFLVIFAGFMLLMCGIGWGIWAVACLVKRKKQVG